MYAASDTGMPQGWLITQAVWLILRRVVLVNQVVC
jgi:hypothetical protein